MLLRIIKSICAYVRAFGLFNGLEIGYKIKTHRVKRMVCKGVAHPFSLRPHTSDLPTFYQVFVLGAYDIPLGFEPRFIVDAGAHIGMAAIFFANKYPKATIFCIEPELSNFRLLEKNTRPYPNIIRLNKALAARDNLELKVRDRGFGTSGFVTELPSASEGESCRNTVKTISMEGLRQRFGLERFDLVKIDIEGYEKELFEVGAEDWLSRTHCLIVELHDQNKAACSRSVFRAVSTQDFSCFPHGESLVFLFEKARK